MDDREAIEDRVISDSRLIEILGEKDAQIYRLEKQLRAAENKLNAIAKLQTIISTIPLKFGNQFSVAQHVSELIIATVTSGAADELVAGNSPTFDST